MNKKTGLILLPIILIGTAILHYEGLSLSQTDDREQYFLEEKISEENQINKENTKSQKEKREITLYAKSAVLMDADSGRVLYGKNEAILLPMASTTKIMTCILALEYGNIDDIVTVSQKAARQPKVHLGMNESEQFLLKDLLYSLMLESHNDSAVAIAEHISGSVEEFAKLMNQKARDIKCFDTYFITPNGLDFTVVDDSGIENKHHTTATDLARIMNYCIRQSSQTEKFLEITRTPTYSFSNAEGTRSFSCTNHNAFLNMMPGALSGKTGFTNQAGYCYVGALERDGMTLIVSLLACGWPNNRSYKWSDTKTLMNYGLENYKFKNFADIEIDDTKLKPVLVLNGQSERIGEMASAQIEVAESTEASLQEMLMRDDEEVTILYNINTKVNAPVYAGDIVGQIKYEIDGKICKVNNVYAVDNVEKIDLRWCLKKVFFAFTQY